MNMGEGGFCNFGGNSQDGAVEIWPRVDHATIAIVGIEMERSDAKMEVRAGTDSSVARETKDLTSQDPVANGN